VAVSDDISILAVGTTLMRSRWRIVRWMLLGAVVALLAVFWKPSLYRASASFMPQGTDAARSGLASLAGQFGVALPSGGNPSLSVDFYAQLLRSPVLLREIVRDTFVVPELRGERISFLDLFGIAGGTPKLQEEQGVKLLTGIVSPSVARTTGLVEVSVSTKWPSVSLAIVTAIVDGVNEYNQRTRQGQAAAERKFVEGRLAVASSELRDAENRLEQFEKTNRQFSAPMLGFERGRLERDVALRQQVFTSLTQANEDVRIREVRDTPVITIFEPPSVPAQPEPRGRVRTIFLGLLLGGFIGAMISLASGTMARLRREKTAEADEFVGTLSELKREVLAPVRSLRDSIGRPPKSAPR
jgi:uncharacterized protein involved in exopolysaccharide biosynthesis